MGNLWLNAETHTKRKWGHNLSRLKYPQEEKEVKNITRSVEGLGMRLVPRPQSSPNRGKINRVSATQTEHTDTSNCSGISFLLNLQQELESLRDQDSRLAYKCVPNPNKISRGTVSGKLPTYPSPNPTFCPK